MKDFPLPELISLSVASKRFGPSVSTLKGKIRTGELRAVRYTPCGKIYVAPDDVRRLAITIQPEAPEGHQEFRARMDGLVNQILGEGWEAKYRKGRRKSTPAQQGTPPVHEDTFFRPSIERHTPRLFCDSNRPVIVSVIVRV